MTRVLFVSSEAHPLVKTGGLGDVSASLPEALLKIGDDVRLILPGYRQALERLGEAQTLAHWTPPFANTPVRLLEARMPGSELRVWLVDSPPHFDRVGNPYLASDGRDWSDNATRFAVFARAVVDVAMGRVGIDWRPEVVHANDWQSGLVPALLSVESSRPASVFTIHNLAYQGIFPWPLFSELDLPPELGSMHGLEFHGRLSFMKGGLAFADLLTTVSPTYAKEIRTPEFGHGLEGLLEHRARRLRGILNGVDYNLWDPSRDPHIAKRYSAKSLHLKRHNKQALRTHFGLEQGELPLLGMVGRLVWQKGADLVEEVLEELLEAGLQMVIVGSGERRLEERFRAHALNHAGRLGVHIGFDERLAHLVEAGSDAFLMPSRYEPCGLNQIYSLRYGTVPIVRATGGLADTVTDAHPAAIGDGTATGFLFEEPTAADLREAVHRALTLYREPLIWRRLMTSGMAQDYSWNLSARRYSELYREALTLRPLRP